MLGMGLKEIQLKVRLKQSTDRNFNRTELQIPRTFSSTAACNSSNTSVLDDAPPRRRRSSLPDEQPLSLGPCVGFYPLLM